MTKGHIASQYASLSAKREAILEHVRKLAAISMPHVCPPDGMDESSRLPRPYQSLLARGVTVMVGRLLTALFPPDRPFFATKIKPEIAHAGVLSDDDLAAITQSLFFMDVMMQARLESADMGSPSTVNRRAGFRSRMRVSLNQLIVTGDTLNRLGDDYRLRVYRRDQYVTSRDSTGQPLVHIIEEKVDPLAMSEAHRRECGFKDEELKAKNVTDRLESVFTLCEWNPLTKVHVIKQECKDKVFNESEESVTSFFNPTFDLSPGESYGRGFIELNEGDAVSFDVLSEKMLDFAALASKLLFFIRHGSDTRPADLGKPTGSVSYADVQGGIVQDVAMLRAEKLNDFRVVAEVMERIRRDLGKSMLIESEAAPTGEAGRSPRAWERIATELEGALGGLYAPIADEFQVPLLRRLMHNMKRDLDRFAPPENVEVDILTGIPALARQAKLGNAIQIVQSMQAVPELARHINLDVLADVLVRYGQVDEPGLIKSKDEVRAELAQQMQLQAQAQAQEQAIKSAGAITENAAAAALQPQQV